MAYTITDILLYKGTNISQYYQNLGETIAALPNTARGSNIFEAMSEVISRRRWQRCLEFFLAARRRE